jgi:hypothetical protein
MTHFRHVAVVGSLRTILHAGEGPTIDANVQPIQLHVIEETSHSK